jgi:2'-5' RNA ligase
VALFSAIVFGNTPFGMQWDAALPSLKSRFPDLRLEEAAHLHITVVYIGNGWDPARIDTYREYGLTAPDFSKGPLELGGSADVFGKQNQVIAIRLTGIPSEWSQRLMFRRQKLTEQGLRQQDRYDSTFEAHITLATAMNPSDPKQRQELNAFQAYINQNKSQFHDFKFELGSSSAPVYLLSVGTSAAPDYQPLDTV